MLRAILGDDAPIKVLEVVDEEQAAAERFPGSPTIRVDGEDLFPIDDPPGLNCRVYRLADGRYSPTPDPNELRDAVDALLSGKLPKVEVTNPIGCNVKWKGKDNHWMPAEACDLV